MSDVERAQVGEWVLRVRVPRGEGPHPVIMMNHGWTGNEEVMWIFASRLPEEALLITPRAPFQSNHMERGGYSWVEKASSEWYWLDDFRPAVAMFSDLLTGLAEQYTGNFAKISLVGFSQGAAFSYAYTLLNPERVARAAGLSGFLPDRCESVVAQKPLKNTPIFIAHGTEDETVPVERGRNAVKLLGEAGGEVTYCEDEVGHKLSANCFRALQSFFAS